MVENKGRILAIIIIISIIVLLVYFKFTKFENPLNSSQPIEQPAINQPNTTPNDQPKDSTSKPQIPSKKLDEIATKANVTQFPYLANVTLLENSKYAVNFDAGGNWYFMEIRGAGGTGTWKATTNRPEGCCRNDTASYQFDVNTGETGVYGIRITIPEQPENQTPATWVFYNVIRQSTIT